MANIVALTSAGIALVLFLFLVALIRHSIKKTHLLATPNIPKEKAVLTVFASARISAPADGVFAALLNYKERSKWSHFSEYNWQNVTDDGIPLIGSKGLCKLSVEGFTEKYLPIRLTVLDRERRMIAERTTSYPSWLLSSELVHEVVPVEGHPRLCEYRAWQTVEGLAAYALRLIVQDELVEAQRMTVDSLKFHLEKSRSKTI